MEKVVRFLRQDYLKKHKNASRECVSVEKLCDYARNTLLAKEKEDIESHLSGCYRCLDMLVAIRAGMDYRYDNKYGRENMKKDGLFLLLAVICFVLSFLFGRYFLQFLAATLILSMKWIVDTKTNRMLIMIYDAWKRSGEKGAGRLLRDLETKNR